MSLRALAKKWIEGSKKEDVYASVEKFSEEAPNLWPYAVLAEQIESGWEDEARGAVALNLARRYSPDRHAVAAFITMAAPWPSADASAALNLLGLVHRVQPAPGFGMRRLLASAALYCLRKGLEDKRPIVAEEAVNILGGLGLGHLQAVSDDDVEKMQRLTNEIVQGLDGDLAEAMRSRVASVLADAPSVGARGALPEDFVAPILRELDPQWAWLTDDQKDLPIVAAIRTHLTALAWSFASAQASPVQVVYVYSAKPDNDVPPFRVLDPWLRYIQDLVLPTDPAPVESTTAPSRHVSFDTLYAATGSLLVTLRVRSETNLEDALAKELRAAKDKPPSGSGAKELADLLNRGGLHVRVAHVEADLTSTSISLSPQKPAEDRALAPLRSRKLTTIEIPQANELERVFAVVACIAREAPVTPDDIGVSTTRQVQYYKAAARLLELITPSGDELTRTGWLLDVAKDSDAKYRRLCASFEASPCGQAWIEWAGVSKLGEIPDGSAHDFLAERSELTGDTIGRRANTLNVWLAKLRSF